MGVHITAAGTGYDCVSRSFFPAPKVNEDPVCGSGHCHIVACWCQTTERRERVEALQVSERGGTLYCRMDNDRVFPGGRAALYLEGTLFLPDGNPGEEPVPRRIRAPEHAALRR